MMAGGGTRKLVGSLRSPSYCMRPTNLRSLGTRTRSNLSNSGPVSKAFEISTTRSERKLKMTTASPSSTLPTGAPAWSTTTKAPRFWSEAPDSAFILATISDATVPFSGASPSTCAFQPRSTMSHSASYRSMVTFIRPPPDAIRASQPLAESSESSFSSAWMKPTPVLSGTSRPSVRTWQRMRLAPSAAALCTIAESWLAREWTPPSESRPMK
mmetsp:Transcript_14287/g.43908  ORF Transcript_14287/g.43908 Transcript_14287/m.43908 type:complete len:213 (+) Transcript_14287:1127-1765(+)